MYDMCAFLVYAIWTPNCICMAWVMLSRKIVGTIFEKCVYVRFLVFLLETRMSFLLDFISFLLQVTLALIVFMVFVAFQTIVLVGLMYIIPESCHPTKTLCRLHLRICWSMCMGVCVCVFCIATQNGGRGATMPRYGSKFNLSWLMKYRVPATITNLRKGENHWIFV